MSAEWIRFTVKSLSDLSHMVPDNCNQIAAVRKDGEWLIACMPAKPAQGQGGAA